ncbi:MAG: hypothetical protein JNL39_05665 [Opitutaceae bacterium]|nr:hypothetical protein [Opitutaceae bacterium]
MNPRWRYPLLLFLSPSLASAHGFEFGGMFLGTCASAVVTLIALLVFPFRPRRRLAIVACYPVAVVSICVGLAALQNGINHTFNYSTWAWGVLSAVLPLVIIGIVYYEFCRPAPSIKDRDAKQDS